MNSDIEKYEEQKLKKTNPKEYKKLKEKERKQKINSRFQYGIFIGLCLINSINDGPPILYLLFGFIPTIIKKSFPSPPLDKTNC